MKVYMNKQPFKNSLYFYKNVLNNLFPLIILLVLYSYVSAERKYTSCNRKQNMPFILLFTVFYAYLRTDWFDLVIYLMLIFLHDAGSLVLEAASSNWLSWPEILKICAESGNCGRSLHTAFNHMSGT